MTAAVRKTEEQTESIEVWPSAFGGKNWMPMSYDPGRRLAFFNTIDLGMKIRYVQARPGPAGRTGGWAWSSAASSPPRTACAAR
jgi:glucose dehydrogenase